MRFNRKLYNRPGPHKSDKGRVDCPNSYIRQTCHLLNVSPKVTRFQFRVVRYRFFHPELERIREGHFDFLVRTTTGRKLIHVFPMDWLSNDVVIARIEAMQLRAKELGVPLEVWTETELFGEREEYRDSLIRYCY